MSIRDVGYFNVTDHKLLNSIVYDSHKSSLRGVNTIPHLKQNQHRSDAMTAGLQSGWMSADPTEAHFSNQPH